MVGMDRESHFVADVGRRVATIEGQVKGIERLLQKRDVPQVLTQSAAVRSALESLVRVLLQASITHRFAMVSLSERPEDVFEYALERAMTHWFSSNVHESEAAAAAGDEAQFWSWARGHTRAIEDRLRDISVVLEGDNYLHALRELGAIHREVDELIKVALHNFIKDRMGDKDDSRKAREAFERVVEHALKYWPLPDPRCATPVHNEPSRKILVVDDDADVVDYLKYTLKKSDYEVLTASDAEEAMRKVEKEKPDLILLDIMMPTGTEGFHFAWRLRAHSDPECRNIPIIVLTAIHDTTDLRFYPDLSDGVYGPGEFLPVEDFVDKPVAEEELLRRVEQVLRAARQR